MKIKEIVYYVTKTTTFEIIMNESLGYDMPETPKELVELITDINNNPARELAWSTDNMIDDTMLVDNYEIKEDQS